MGGRGGESGPPEEELDEEEIDKSESGTTLPWLKRKLKRAGSDQEKTTITRDWLERNLVGDKNPVPNPIYDKEYDMYMIEIGGTNFFFENINDALAKTVMAFVYGKNLPAALRSNMEAILMVPEGSPSQQDFLAQERDGIIVVWGGNSIGADTLAHEGAHALAEDRWGSAVPPNDSDYYRAATSGEPGMGAYGDTNMAEDFAEAVEMFIMRPENMKQFWPERYAVIRKMMNDRMYGG